MADLAPWQELLARLVEAGVWPAVAVAAIVILRQPLKDLIGRLQHAKWGDKSLDFDQIQRIEEEGKRAAPAQEAEFSGISKEESADLLDVARISPRAAITESWVRLEHALRETAKKMGADPDERRPIHSAVSILREKSELPLDFFHVVDEMRQVRNRAVHYLDYPPSTLDVSGYVRTAARLAEAARSAKQR